MQYFKISKVTCVTHKTGCFEYVIRLCPNDTWTHHRRSPLDAQNGATPAERKPRPTPDTQKGETRAAEGFTTSGEINSPLRPMSLYNFLVFFRQCCRLSSKYGVHGFHVRRFLRIQHRIQHDQFLFCQLHQQYSVQILFLDEPV